jgi:hypothetical protein
MLDKIPGLSFRGGSGLYELWDAGAVEIIPPDRRIAMDFGTLASGPMRWKPFDTSRMRPCSDGLWPILGSSGADADGYQDAIALQWLLEGVGMVVFRTTSRGALPVLERVHTAFHAAPEAAEGLLPCFRLAVPTWYAPKQNPTGRAFVPVFVPFGWMRRVSEFGRRLVPAPRVLPPALRASTDRLFDEIEHHGLIEPPRRRGFDDAEPWGDDR